MNDNRALIAGRHGWQRIFLSFFSRLDVYPVHTEPNDIIGHDRQSVKTNSAFRLTYRRLWIAWSFTFLFYFIRNADRTNRIKPIELN